MNMTDKYKFRVTVEMPMSNERRESNFEVCPFSNEDIRKIRECDHAAGVMLTGDLTFEEAEKKREARKKIIDDIAGRIASDFVKHIAAQDTLNGYPIQQL